VEDRVEWHIITGEYPPNWGGVSDYTYRITQELAKNGDRVHVWSPASRGESAAPEMADVHALPRGFGWRWLRELDRGLRRFGGARNILIQYVPHMYGWKSMNLAFCLWICLQRRHRVLVMFHEVAFPFRPRQRYRHALLALVHRVMAWAILRRVQYSFTSTEPYLALLKRLGSHRSQVSLLRICSNIPTEDFSLSASSANANAFADGLFTVGVFSNFAATIRGVLEPAIERLLENPRIAVLLLGPGEALCQALAARRPDAAARIRTTGRQRVTAIAEHMRNCDALLQLYPDGASAARGTLIGALASGCPLVTNSGPATDRLLLDSKAMLFADGTPESIRGAIELLRENPALAGEFAARAQRLYEECFQPAVIVSRMRDALRSSNADLVLMEEQALQD
jgi:glycosyltransferase involved in cell wall biosynthesis